MNLSRRLLLLALFLGGAVAAPGADPAVSITLDGGKDFQRVGDALAYFAAFPTNGAYTFVVTAKGTTNVASSLHLKSDLQSLGTWTVSAPRWSTYVASADLPAGRHVIRILLEGKARLEHLTILSPPGAPGVTPSTREEPAESGEDTTEPPPKAEDYNAPVSP